MSYKKQFIVFAGALAVVGAMISMQTANTVQGGLASNREHYWIIELSETKETAFERNVQTEQSDFNPFQLEECYEDEAYRVTGVCADEPIIALLLDQFVQSYGLESTDEPLYTGVAAYEIVSYLPQQDGTYEFCLTLFQEADCTLYQYTDGALQESTLSSMQREEVIQQDMDNSWYFSYSSPSNHWLVLHLWDTSLEMEPEESVIEVLTEFEEENRIESKERSQELPTRKPEIKENSEKKTVVEECASENSSQSIHSHNWEAVTETIHHDAVYDAIWTEDHAAYDEIVVVQEPWSEECLIQEAWEEPVYSYMDVCNVCGYVYPIGSGIDEYSYHQFVDPADGGGWYTKQVQTGSIYHDAVYETVFHEAQTQSIHHEAQGHYENRLVQEAWDESVITGYVCTGCNAVR